MCLRLWVCTEGPQTTTAKVSSLATSFMNFVQSHVLELASPLLGGGYTLIRRKCSPEQLTQTRCQLSVSRLGHNAWWRLIMPTVLLFCRSLWTQYPLQQNPMHVHSEVTPTEFRKTYSQVNVNSIAGLQQRIRSYLYSFICNAFSISYTIQNSVSINQRRFLSEAGRNDYNKLNKS